MIKRCVEVLNVTQKQPGWRRPENFKYVCMKVLSILTTAPLTSAEMLVRARRSFYGQSVSVTTSTTRRLSSNALWSILRRQSRRTTSMATFLASTQTSICSMNTWHASRLPGCCSSSLKLSTCFQPSKSDRPSSHCQIGTQSSSSPPSGLTLSPTLPLWPSSRQFPMSSCSHTTIPFLSRMIPPSGHYNSGLAKPTWQLWRMSFPWFGLTSSQRMTTTTGSLGTGSRTAWQQIATMRMQTSWWETRSISYCFY